MYEDRESRHLNERKKEPTDSISRHTIYLYGGAILVLGRGFITWLVFELFWGMSNNVDRRFEAHLLFSVLHVLVVRVCGGVGGCEVQWERGEREAKTTY